MGPFHRLSAFHHRNVLWLQTTGIGGISPSLLPNFAATGRVQITIVTHMGDPPTIVDHGQGHVLKEVPIVPFGFAGDDF